MNLVGRAFGSVSKTWNSINPATLSGAIDVIVVEQENGDLACSPFHVRFGKFQLLRPSEKKVDFKVNGEKVPYAMKLGDGGEAFFVFQTESEVPFDLQTSPVLSPIGSPIERSGSPMQEPEFFDLNDQQQQHIRASSMGDMSRPNSAIGDAARRSPPPGNAPPSRPKSGDWDDFDPTQVSEPNTNESFHRRHTITDSDPVAPKSNATGTLNDFRARNDLSLKTQEALLKAEELMKKLAVEDIPTHITDAGDIMLDMHGYKSNEEDFAHIGSISEHIAAAEELTNNGLESLVSADEQGNLWIYATQETKQSALSVRSNSPVPDLTDESRSEGNTTKSPPATPPAGGAQHEGDSYNYAKTLRLTSEQLRSLELKSGENSMSFSVGKSICTASLFFWKFNSPIVISDIDGTITKSDALGHLLNMVGRDWTHVGVAKLYTDIANNGYNWLYLSSRSVGQADTTRNYLRSIVQDKYKLPHGPVILSPDRTMAALRREVILRKPEVFKMQCLRDLQNLFGKENKPFHAGFGNRITDAISYRYVDVKSSRIFTINSYGDVQMELLQFAGYKSSYLSMNDLVDHFFPPVNNEFTKDEGDFTDFAFWRSNIPEIDFSDDEDRVRSKTSKPAKTNDNDSDDDVEDDPDYAPSASSSSDAGTPNEEDEQLSEEEIEADVLHLRRLSSNE
ncbi:protein of unknown function [Taphrina deformans PYCC 5710]|uniref:LNS2/PITP domain-containing protein n=1 Tax=Taphrina deformans (strain PYCC 5710 / ATCC 11124 / CBS 356.35 / IMI 108563 / JCM 9778 / NBRC 8474) TaxID=1097556 RepID=R4XHC7_TAPDE|nr:protein of unknown function [Taphrina deformans PYCC 5710]|eukprot:CCG85093.1 protein of unknown function [Taphrina deformans PYCC 5710]